MNKTRCAIPIIIVLSVSGCTIDCDDEMGDVRGDYGEPGRIDSGDSSGGERWETWYYEHDAWSFYWGGIFESCETNHTSLFVGF